MTYYLRRVIAFYRGNFQNYGFRGVARVTAALFLHLFRPLVIRIGPRIRHCPCCGWRGSHFMPFLATGYIVFETQCPSCTSAPRHRAHRLFYENRLHFSQREGKLLYFAPEHNLVYFKANLKLEVKTSNYPDGEADYHIDMLDIPFADGQWDYIVCHRVVEHVSDDRRGMMELCRVLKPGGFAVISVPLDSDVEKTIEYGKPNPLENEHYYYYGKDFITRIPDCFEVDAYRFSDTFTAAEHTELALIDDYIFVCRKPDAAGN